jgi:hypothetical protein
MSIIKTFIWKETCHGDRLQGIYFLRFSTIQQSTTMDTHIFQTLSLKIYIHLHLGDHLLQDKLSA